MTLEQVFSASGTLAMIGWVVLIFAPRRWAWLNLVPQIVVPLALSVLYAGFILAYFADSGGGYGSLAEVRQLFSLDELLLAGWIHYLAFDLMVGGFLAGRMDRIGIQRIVQAPILFATFMFGPVGVLLAFGTEAVVRVATPRFAKA
ncbi:ABA4-like family protein [Roseibium sp. MMSF_3544]|uniref:ABA4-like family protein n=1 Tax=unclassified Roseibium TaxID=2629323 RepID=UPI00273EDB7E|nr:ABA4-like family protein [Roseibium sp. MMSF_3544]